MRSLALTTAAAMALAAGLHSALVAAESKKVVVTVRAIRASGERKGAPEFGPDVVGLRGRLERHFPGYKKYEQIEQLAKSPSLKAPARFSLQTGQTVTITVVAFDKGRFVAQLEIHSGDTRVGKLTVRGREGTYNYAAVSRKANELIVVAFKVTRGT